MSAVVAKGLAGEWNVERVEYGVIAVRKLDGATFFTPGTYTSRDNAEAKLNERQSIKGRRDTHSYAIVERTVSPWRL